MTPSKHIIHLFFSSSGKRDGNCSKYITAKSSSQPLSLHGARRRHPRQWPLSRLFGMPRLREGHPREAVGTTPVASKPAGGKPPSSPSPRHLPSPTLPRWQKSNPAALIASTPFRMKASQIPAEHWQTAPWQVEQKTSPHPHRARQS